MTPDCADIRDDIDAYAIGALDPDDARRVGEHVAGCAECAALLAAARDAAAALATTVHIVSPGPATKARVMAAARPFNEPITTSRRMDRWRLAAAAVLVAALAGASAWAVFTQRRIDDLEHRSDAARVSAAAQARQLAAAQTALADVATSSVRLEASLSTQQTVIDVVSQPDLQRVGLRGTGAAPLASAQYLWSPARDAGVLIANHLAVLNPHQTYQLWVVYGSTWESAGTFSVDASGRGSLVAAPTAHDDGAAPPAWYCVTIERAGGSTNHSGTMVLSSLLH